MKKVFSPLKYKVAAAAAYLVMVTVNALANILPINGISTGAISDSYPNLFAPAGITFSIWGLIYLLLGIYTVALFVRKFSPKTEQLLERLNRYFILSSIINSVWIFAWHYQLIPVTLVLMLGILYCLIRIADLIKNAKLTLPEKLLTKLPFGVYFGWITVATIANVTTLLVSLGWHGFGISESTWMLLVLAVGTLIAIWRLLADSNIAYGLVPVWAYYGIWFKHTSPSGFDSQYPVVITATIVCISALLLANGYLAAKQKPF